MRDSIYATGEYARKSPTYHVEDSAWKAVQILRMIRRHGLTMESVAEIGCGAGEILRELQRQLPVDVVFYGYDISPQAIALSKARANERLTFFCEDLLSKATEQFDLLLCIDVVEHVEDYMGFLRRMRAKASRFIFHIPLDLSVQMVLRCRPILRAREEVGHLHYFMKETALATLRSCDYQILGWEYTPSGLDQPKSLEARLMKAPRRVLFAASRDLAVRLLGGYSLLVLAQ